MKYSLTKVPAILLALIFALFAYSSAFGQANIVIQNSDFAGTVPGTVVPGTWYGNALANALSNQDRNGPTAEINAQFNSQVGIGTCLTGAQWYYGLDNNHGSNGIDLLSVALHEFAHGLGF